MNRIEVKNFLNSEFTDKTKILNDEKKTIVVVFKGGVARTSIYSGRQHINLSLTQSLFLLRNLIDQFGEFHEIVKKSF
jgi:hypothetical protein